MGKFCLYADTQSDAPCIVIPMYKYSYLENFMDDIKHTKGVQRHSVPIKISCLKSQKDGHSRFIVKDEICVNCLFCVFGCIGNKILISKKYHPLEFCYDISQEEIEGLSIEVSKLFKGEFIHLPKVPLSQLSIKYKSFEDFTSVKETENIAVWTANALKFLSSSMEPRVALEVGLQISQRDRGGRLDVTLLNIKDKYLFVAETKVDFIHMIREGRYESQMIAYETELSQVPCNVKRAKFLVIGGKESDLLPTNIIGSTAGPRGKQFYDVLNEHSLFFFSANSLLALGLMRLYVSIKSYSLENLYKIMVDKRYVGVLSSGVITYDKKLIPLSEALKS
ncbi:MAG: hypothetical protein IJ845_07985 [Bacteroidaceae bacterium]|nr:hypothetical protein [Bacteroidaceae bacterium]